MRKYHIKTTPLAFSPLWTKAILAALMVMLIYTIPMLLERALSAVHLDAMFTPVLDTLRKCILTIGATLLLLSCIILVATPKTAQIAHMVKRGLFDPSRSNPLHLHENERLPCVRCKRIDTGLYELSISANQSVTVDTIKAAAPAISSSLTGRFAKCAVVGVEQDIAYNSVIFRVENVKVCHALTFTSVEQMRPASPTLLRVDAVNSIDLTTSGSMLVAGKTRSGKSTGTISLLLQVLKCGPDNYGSEVKIIDPKRAELSMLPHTVTVDEDGEATKIIDTLSRFEATIVKRQRALNDLSVKTGDAVKWWDAGFHPSLVFIDEYVACRSLLPKKAPKGREGYDLDTFDGLLKRIITMGASAGCFAIISIAEASVQEGGLPAMLRSAMSTKILFKPTKEEARLMWDAEKVKQMPENRVYNAGDAWFSSTDGVHDFVSNVHFPRMDFPVYRELGRLLRAYYGYKHADSAPPPSEAEAAALSENIPL